jgi:plastocyanin
MVKKFTVYLLLLIIGAASAMPFQISAGQSTGEENETSPNGSNNMSKTGAMSGNNTIGLNAAEVGEEQYRWVDSSGAENPPLALKANTEYTFVISNPTDEEHELIIDSAAEGKVSEIAKSDEIEPQSEDIEFKFKTDKAGELGYHCEYHPDMMNGTIKVTQ